MTYWGSQLLNGLSFGMLLYLISVGLTVTLGVMRLVNLTHGSFYLIGAYVAYDVVNSTGSFALGIVAAVAAVVVLGAITYPLLRAVGTDHLAQALLTFGLLFIVADLALLRWGGGSLTVSRPEMFTGPWSFGEFLYPSYRFALIAIGLVVAAALEYLQRRTLAGALLRSTVDDPQMTAAVGRDPRRINAGSFLVGAGLAGFGGVLGGALIGASPGLDIQVLLLALIIVIVGGLGSISGALIGSVLVGVLDTVGRSFAPQVGGAFIFLLMLIVLSFKPTGLLGRES